MQRRIFPFLAALAVFMFLACSEDSNDDELQIIQGSVSGIQLQVLNNGGTTPSVNADSEYPKGAFMLAIHVSTNSQAWGKSGRTVVDLDDPIKAIRIYALHPFNDAYPAGSEISSLFRQYPLYVNNNLDDTLERGKYIERIDHLTGYFYKALLTEPTPGVNQLKVEIVLESGKIYTAETQEFTFI